MDFFIPDLEATERDVDQLIASLSDQSEAAQHGAEIDRLKKLLARIDRQLASMDGLIGMGIISDSEPNLVSLRKNREKVAFELKELQVAAPRSAFEYARQLEKNPPSLDLPAVSKYEPHEVMSGETGRRGLLFALLFLGMIGFTLWVGWQRLSATPRQGAYISSPSESQIINR